MTQTQGYVLTRDLPPIPAKRYFTIGEVSQLCDVRSYVLRYWESEFTQLTPMKRRGNRRYYQLHEVMLVREIRELLYEKGYTIVGARRQLEQKMVSDAAKFELAPSSSSGLEQGTTKDELELNTSNKTKVVQDTQDSGMSLLDEADSGPKFIPVADIMAAELATDVLEPVTVHTEHGHTHQQSVADSQQTLQVRAELMSHESTGAHLDDVVDKNLPMVQSDTAPAVVLKDDITQDLDAGGQVNRTRDVDIERSVARDYLHVHIEQIHQDVESTDARSLDKKLDSGSSDQQDERLHELTTGLVGVATIADGPVGAQPLTLDGSVDENLSKPSEVGEDYKFSQAIENNRAQSTTAESSTTTIMRSVEENSDIGLSLESEQSLVEAAAHAAHIAAEKAAIALQAAEALANERSLQLKRIQEHVHAQAQELERLVTERQARSDSVRQAIAQLNEIRMMLGFDEH